MLSSLRSCILVSSYIPSLILQTWILKHTTDRWQNNEVMSYPLSLEHNICQNFKSFGDLKVEYKRYHDNFDTTDQNFERYFGEIFPRLILGKVSKFQSQTIMYLKMLIKSFRPRAY